MDYFIYYIIQLILVFSLFIIAIVLINLDSKDRKERRITRFAIDSLNNKNISFSEKVNKKFAKIISDNALVLEKSTFFKKRSLKYNKYIINNNSFFDNALKFIVLKFVFGLFLLIITLISDTLKLHDISLIQLIFAFLVGYFGFDIYLLLKKKKIMKAKEDDLLSAIVIMDNAFKSGKSIMQTIELVSDELDGPLKEEFKKMFIDLNYGLDIETVFNRFSTRVNIEEASYMASGIIILNKTGGNIVNIFDTIQKGYFDRKKLKEELKSTTTLSNFVFRLLCLLPLLLVTVISIWNNEFFKPLFTTDIGKLLLIIIIFIYITYVFVINKIKRMDD